MDDDDARKLVLKRSNNPTPLSPVPSPPSSGHQPIRKEQSRGGIGFFFLSIKLSLSSLFSVLSLPLPSSLFSRSSNFQWFLIFPSKHLLIPARKNRQLFGNPTVSKEVRPFHYRTLVKATFFMASLLSQNARRKNAFGLRRGRRRCWQSRKNSHDDRTWKQHGNLLWD